MTLHLGALSSIFLIIFLIKLALHVSIVVPTSTLHRAHHHIHPASQGERPKGGLVFNIARPGAPIPKPRLAPRNLLCCTVHIYTRFLGSRSSRSAHHTYHHHHHFRSHLSIHPSIPPSGTMKCSEQPIFKPAKVYVSFLSYP